MIANVEKHFEDVIILQRIERLVIDATLTSRGIEVERSFALRLYKIIEKTDGDSDYEIVFNDLHYKADR